MTDEVKNQIKILFDLKLKPNKIHEEIYDKFKPYHPSKNQMHNFLASHKKEKYGPS